MGWRDDVLELTETFEQVSVTADVLLENGTPFAVELAATVDSELRDRWTADVHVALHAGAITATLTWHARRDDAAHEVFGTRREMVRQLVDVCSGIEGVIGVR
jgi:hypothetical protein